MTAYSLLLAIMIASSVWLHDFPHAYAVTSYAPGVKVGDFVTYGEFSVNNTTPYPYFQVNISSVTVHVDSVVASTNFVGASFVTMYRNGSQTTSSLNGTTDTQSGNLYPYIIAGGLSAGDALWKNQYPYNVQSVNETVSKVYAGALRTVNLINITYQSSYQSVRYSLYWDVKTGFLLEAYENDNYTSPSGPQVIQIYFEATQTNVWTPDSTPDFSIDSIAQTSSAHLGENISYRLDMMSLNRFNGTISLAESLLGAVSSHPPSVTLSSASVSVSAQNPTATSILTLETNSSTSMGSYLIGINATSGTVFHRAVVAVDVSPPDYTITASPGNLTLSQGRSKNSTITVRSLGAFNGVVTLQAYPQFFNSPLTAVLSTNTVTLNSTSAIRTAILSVKAPLTAPPGVGGVSVNGVSGNIYRSTFVSVNVTGPDFRMTLNPTSLILKEGRSATSVLTLTSILGFSGTVNLSTSTYGPVTASLAASSLSLAAGGSATINVTLSTPVTGPPGIYSAYVYGTSGNIQHSAYINLNVTGPDFRFVANIYSVTLQAGHSANATLTLRGVAGFSGTVAFSTSTYGPIAATVTPTAVFLNSTQSSATALLTISVPLGGVPGYYSVSTSAASGNIVHYVDISVQVIGPDFTISSNPAFLSLRQGDTGTSTISLTSILNFTGTVQVFANNYYPPSLGVSLSSNLLSLSPGGIANSTLTVQVPGTTAPGYYFVNIVASSGQLTRSISVEVQVTGPTFTILSSPYYLTIPQGHSANSTITLTSIDNFNKPVNITASTQYLTRVSVSPRTMILTPPSNASLTTTLTFSVPANTAPGFYYFQIIAVGGNLTIYTDVQVDVTGPDFSLALNPYSLTLMPGASSVSTITLTSILGFSGNVTLSASPFGVNGTLTKQFVQLSANGTASLELIVHVPAALQSGYYSFFVNATNGFISHYAYLYVQVVAPDFTLYFTQNTITVPNGQSAQALLTVKSLNGFNGTVSISLPGFVQPGVTATLNASSVKLVAGASTFVTLNVTASNSAGDSAFYVSIQATSGNLTRYTYIYLYVISPSFTLTPNPQFLNIQRGDSAVSSLTVSSVDGFKGNISLDSSGFSGISTSITPRNVTLTAGGSATVLVSIAVSSSTLPGFYGISLTGTNGTIVVGGFMQVQVVGPDFSLSIQPFSFSLKPGTSANATVTLTSLLGFHGNVTLSAFGFAFNATLTSNRLSLAANGTATTSLSIYVPVNTLGGGYSVLVNATSGFITHTQYIFVQVITPDFAMQANPFSLQIKPGASAQSTITLNSFNGFNGTVILSTLQLFQNGVNSTLSRSNVTLTSGGSASVTLTVTASRSAPSQSFYVTIKGTSGNLTRYTYVFVSVIAPDFSLSFSPPFTLQVKPGGSVQSTFTVTSFNGFNGTVSLSTNGFFSGVNATLSSRNVTLTSGGSATVMLTVSASLTAPSQSFYLTIQGSSGNLTRYSSIFVSVISPDFALSSSPSFPSIPRGSSTSGTLTIQSLSGFSGNVNLTASAVVTGFNTTSASALSVTFSPKIVSLVSGGSATSNVTITVPSSTVPGFYAVVIQATSGKIVRTLFVQVQVTGTSFSLSPVLSFLQLNAGTIGDTAVIVTALNGFSGPLSLSASSSPAGLNVTMNPATVTLNSTVISTTAFLTIRVPAHPVAGYYLVTVTGSGGGLNVTSFVTVFVTAFDFSLNAQPSSLTVVQGASNTSTITVSSLNGLSGFVNLRALLLPPTLGISVSLGSGILFVQNNQTVSTSLTVSASPTAAIGNYTIVLVGSFNTPSGTPVGHALNVTLTIVSSPDFQLIANPPNLSIVQGSSGTSSINATSLNSFAGIVSLTSTVSPPGLTVSIANSTIFLAGGGTALTTLTMSARTDVVGNFTIIVAAYEGGIIHSVNIQVYVAPKPSFSITAIPSSLTVQAGSSAPIILSLQSLNGFSGVVQVFPTHSIAGVSFTPSVPAASLSVGGIVNVTVTVNAAISTSPGIYNITFVGNATSGAHGTSMTLAVLPPPDFTLTANTSGLVIPAGASGILKISIAPLHGFTGSVALTSNAPAGFVTSYSPNPVLGGSGSSTLTLSIVSTVAIGNYTVTVTGTGGSFTHAVSVRVTVSAAPKVTVAVGQVSWAHRVSLKRAGGVETWTMVVKNTGQTPAYFQIAIAGNSTSSALSFSLMTRVTLLSPGASMTITLSQPFTSSSIGLKYNFAVNLSYGSGIYPLGNIISPLNSLVTNGSFTVAR